MSGATGTITLACEVMPAHEAHAEHLVTAACTGLDADHQPVPNGCRQEITLAMCSRDEADLRHGALACFTCRGVLEFVQAI